MWGGGVTGGVLCEETCDWRGVRIERSMAELAEVVERYWHDEYRRILLYQCSSVVLVQ